MPTARVSESEIGPLDQAVKDFNSIIVNYEK